MSSLIAAERRGGAPLLLVASTLMACLAAGCGGSSSSNGAAAPPDATSVTPNTGSTAGGTAVVVAGTGFAAGATVSFGGVAGTVTGVTATAISVTTPARAAGAVDVVVTSTDAQADTLVGAFTYQPPPVDALWVVPDLAANLTTGAGGQVEAFLAGGLYVNAHTAANPPGEIRGQLDQTGTIRLASLDAAQESDTITSLAFGAGILQVNTTSGRVRGFVITSGLTSITNAHVHRALRTTPPTPGGVVIDLVRSDANRDLWLVPDDAPALTPELVTAFQAGELYYNVHTSAHAAGEIRGQLDKAGTIRLATLDGVQESDAFTTSAFGAGIMAVDEATGLSAGFAVTSGLASVTNAHVHQAGRTTPPTPGGVVVGMKFGPNLVVIPDQPTALTTTPTTGGVAAFLAGNLYFNVHTAAHTGGEIRGQLDKQGEVRVTAMNGAQEAPTPVTTTAVGAGLVGVDATTGRPSGFIITRGLSSPTVAHVHAGARGAGGGPFLDLDGP